MKRYEKKIQTTIANQYKNHCAIAFFKGRHSRSKISNKQINGYSVKLAMASQGSSTPSSPKKAARDTIQDDDKYSFYKTANKPHLSQKQTDRYTLSCHKKVVGKIIITQKYSIWVSKNKY